MPQYMIPHGTILSHTLDANTQTSIFSFFTEEETRSSYYRANIPLYLDFTTLHPETDIPFLMTVTAPDFFLHTSLNQEEFEQLMPKQGMHQHNTYDLIFILEGEFYQRIENEWHRYIPGSCCLLNTNVRHMEDYSRSCRFVTLSLAPDFLKSLFSREQELIFQVEREREETDLTKFILQNTSEDDQIGKNYIDFIPRLGKQWIQNNIHHTFDVLTQQILTPGDGSTFMIKALICQIFRFLDCEEYYHTQPIHLGNSVETSIFTTVTKYMEKTHGRISRSELANLLNYSGSTISTVVRKYTGMSIFSYGTSFTMQEAARLLSSTSLNVSEIATRLSFSDRTHFYKLFREAYGMTPKEYRKQSKK